MKQFSVVVVLAMLSSFGAKAHDGPAKVYITEKVILLDAGEEGQLSIDVETGKAVANGRYYFTCESLN